MTEIFLLRIYWNKYHDGMQFKPVINSEGNECNHIAIENIYEYIIPIDGQSQGNFEPIIKITSPKKLQLATLNMP